MKKTILYISFAFLFYACLLRAEVYDLQDHSLGGINRLLRLNIPDSLSDQTLRGILIWGNGAGGNATSRATNAEFVAFAEHYGVAILATGYWRRFEDQQDREIELFESMIAEFAELSGHTELVHAPWLPLGHSNGGQMSYGLNAKRPDKTIGFITSKGYYYNDFDPPVESLMTPGLIIEGELDNGTAVHRNLFFRNREKGALWSWIEEEGSPHALREAYNLQFPFIEECFRLRYPKGQLPIDGPVQLKSLDEYDGYLSDPETWNNGDLVSIERHVSTEGDFLRYCWFPSERIAKLYQAFSSYDKIATHDQVETLSRVVEEGSAYTYQVHLNRDNWEKIEFYIDGVKFGESSNEGENTLDFEALLKEGGLYTAYAIATLNDGTQRSTALRTFFQKGPPRMGPLHRWMEERIPDSIELVGTSHGVDLSTFSDVASQYEAIRGQLTPIHSSRYTLIETIDETRVAFDLLCRGENESGDYICRLSYHIPLEYVNDPVDLENRCALAFPFESSVAKIQVMGRYEGLAQETVPDEVIPEN